MRMMTLPMKTPTKPTTNNIRRAPFYLIQRIPLFPHLGCWGMMLIAAFLASQLLIFPGLSAAFGLSEFAYANQRKPSPNDCIFYATVFTNEGRLLVGAEIHVRPTGKKKPDLEAWSDRRGEFAVRVPPGVDYDIEVKAEGFVTQVRTANAQTGRQDMVFHMEPQPAKKQ